MIITLTPDIEQALTVEARKRGRTPEQLALDSLRDRFLFPDTDISLSAEQTSLADFLRGHIGVLHSSEHVPGGARLSENSGRKFASGLAAKRQEKRSCRSPMLEPLSRHPTASASASLRRLSVDHG